MKAIRSTIFAVALAAFPAAAEAQISVVSTPSIIPSSEMTARMRWGRTGWELGLLSGSQTSGATTLNPQGTPFWQLNTPYKFSVTWDHVTGTLSLDVDNKSISRSVFQAPQLASYQGLGFEYLTISGNGNPNTSSVTDLTINGTSFASINPSGFTEVWYQNASPGSVTINGTLTFNTAGTSDESPAWNFRFRSARAAAVVPEPSSFALLGVGIAGLVMARRRRAA